MRRKKNPPPEHYFERPTPKPRKKKRRTSQEVRLAKNVKRRKYREHAKALRESRLFGDLFDTKNGVDFRTSPDNWPAATKTRITKYWEEMAPRLTGDYVAKRFYRKDRLASAAIASLQGKLLKGQKAVAFSVDRGEDLEVSFSRKGKIKVVRGGIHDEKIFFNMDNFIKDHVKELNRVLDTTDSKVFKIITGKNESSDGFTRSALITWVSRWVLEYAEDDPAENISKYDKWLLGIIEYPELSTTAAIEKRSMEHEKQVAVRQRGRLAQLARDKKPITAAEKRSIQLTGRSGRVK